MSSEKEKLLALKKLSSRVSDHLLKKIEGNKPKYEYRPIYTPPNLNKGVVTGALVPRAIAPRQIENVIEIPRPIVPRQTIVGNLVSIRLTNGLGNRIFQVLAAIEYANKHNKEFVLCKYVCLDGSKPHEQNLNEMIKELFPSIKWVDFFINYTEVREIKQWKYSELQYKVTNVLLNGFFQDEKYFPSNDKIPVLKTTYYENTYFVHIRAGDYLLYENEWGFDLTDYYENCFNTLGKDVNYLVFSNDNKYAEGYMKEFNIKYTLSDKTEQLDVLREMANCAGGICANSTFSWLGAFFQGDKRGKIFMPNIWKKGYDCSGIYPTWATTVSFKIKEYVSVVLQYGFANRLFHIFNGMSYAKKYNKEFIFCKDKFIKGNIPHEQGLDPMILSLFPDIKIFNRFTNYTEIKEITHQKYLELQNVPGNVLLYGHFQSPKYFSSLNIFPKIKTDYYKDTYFIHIRAGDYIGNTGHDIDLRIYYKNCIHILGKDVNYLVFSNDNKYAEGYIKEFNIKYTLSDKTEQLDVLREMANCAGGICANSTFSWMGAFFQGDKRGKIFMPSKWLIDNLTSDIYPNWAIIISNTKEFIKYDKIAITTYGKTGSSTLALNLKCIEHNTIADTYIGNVKTHYFDVIEDLLKKYTNMLFIVTVRQPIDLLISQVFQNISKICPEYNNLSVEQFLDYFNNLLDTSHEYNLNCYDSWLNTLFNLLNINIDTFNFNYTEKYTVINKNTNTILFYRFEDIDYIFNNVLLKYGIYINNIKVNDGKNKFYSDLYINFKNIYNVRNKEKQYIYNSIYINKFYKKNEIYNHIRKYTHNFYTLKEWQNTIKSHLNLIIQTKQINTYDSYEKIPMGIHSNWIKLFYNDISWQIGSHDNLVLCAISNTTDQIRRPIGINRTSILDTLEKNNIDYMYLSSKLYFKTISTYKFIISPEGKTVDCNRHYEALIAGCIPIIEYSYEIVEKYKGCPILYTKDYSEITRDYLEQKYLEMKDKVYDFNKLFLSYYSKEDNTTRIKNPIYCENILVKEDIKNHNNIKWITLINSGYINFTKNFLLSMKINNCVFDLIIYCIDNESMSSFSNFPNVTCIPFNKNKLNNNLTRWDTIEYKRIVFAKLDVIKQSLLSYPDSYIGYIDTDIILLKDPSYTIINKFRLNNNVLFVCQCDESSKECNNMYDCKNLCSGVIVFKNTDTVNNLLNYSDNDINNYSGDQAFISSMSKKYSISYVTVSKNIFLNGIYPGVNRYDVPLIVPDTADLIHYNYLIGNDKIKLMQKNNMWYI